LWPRTDAVTFESAVDLKDKSLESSTGELLPVQQLHDGRWIFLAKTIPPLGSAVYRIVANKSPKTPSASMIQGNVLDNGIVKVEIDPKTGVISSFTMNADTFNYAGPEGLNGYLYSGQMLHDLQTIRRIKRIVVLDDGEVAATLRIESEAPGCNSLLRDITVYKGLGRADIVNTLDKTAVYKKENVRFAFPFRMPNAEITMDIAMGEMHPERDQLVGSNKNFYSILNGIAVNNLQHGIMMTSVDAPFVELGEMTAEDWKKERRGEGWMSAAVLSPTIYSWVMNNSWGTNYKASQSGQVRFCYSLEACDPYDVRLKRQGIEQAQKLVCVVSDKKDPVTPLFRLKDDGRIALSTIKPVDDGTAYLLRLQNLSSKPVHSAFEWLKLQPKSVFRCDNNQQWTGHFNHASFRLMPFECVTLKVKK
jgi:alpha-mannosidase